MVRVFSEFEIRTDKKNFTEVSELLEKSHAEITGAYLMDCHSLNSRKCNEYAQFHARIESSEFEKLVQELKERFENTWMDIIV